MRDFGVVLAAAGAGRRFGARKQLLELLGRPLVHYSLDAFAAVEDVRAIVLVMALEDLEAGVELVRRWQDERRRNGVAAAVEPETVVVAGGIRRQDSVRNGLDALPPAVRYALVHDAARPLIRPEDVRKLIQATREHGAAVIGTPSHDSVKRVKGTRIIAELPRDEVWTVQTPQSAEVSVLREAYDRARDAELTDEASALRAMGVHVALVEGPRENLKITRPGDEALAELILRARGNHGKPGDN